MRISDWSSDVCSSDLRQSRPIGPFLHLRADRPPLYRLHPVEQQMAAIQHGDWQEVDEPQVNRDERHEEDEAFHAQRRRLTRNLRDLERRSEEHTSELQSLMRISYAVFCLKKKNTKN